ncbi:uncharacterized protein MYCFIDRAFT_194059 [Pseudocercospora fijiensis CIRAD86]|uniref:Uncharacterized protein n=1 Tax=Pseudocercospora fijiensis (strain CIRAD86) TaxID=383855 RepID=M3B9B1_PSEFD|nr:uncharacterized protein MYCFIDRAFT_194059 [Pseudocercospora fijiensis CIRAD86]EME85848.1 hypothetical protein MYCFIDRAFT_194059 [Pseudocercospora fijiensis CIRAD86]
MFPGFWYLPKATMPPSTPKPSKDTVEQDETGTKTWETVLDGALDKIADLLNAHRAMQPLWKVVELGADAGEALQHRFSGPLRTDVTRDTAGVLCLQSILPIVSTVNLGFERSLLALALCVIIVPLHSILELHSTLSLLDAFSALGAFFLPDWLLSVANVLAILLGIIDNTQAGRELATGKDRASDSTDETKSCRSVEDAPKSKPELRRTSVSRNSDTAAPAAPTPNLTTILQGSLGIAQNNIKLLELARTTDRNLYNANVTSYRAKMAEMTEAHRAETADLQDRLVKASKACGQMQATSQQEIDGLRRLLSQAQKQIEAERNTIVKMRSFWEADVISKRNALTEKQTLLNQVTAKLDSTTKRFKDHAELTKSKESKRTTQAVQQQQKIQTLEYSLTRLQSDPSTSQDTLHATQTKLLEQRNDDLKEIQTLKHQLEDAQHISETSEKRVKTLRNWCEYWREAAASEHDMRIRADEEIELAKEGIEKIGGEEVEDARKEDEEDGFEMV